MTISDESLMAYADGELDETTRATIEAAMREDPEIRKRVARHRALRAAMQGALSTVLDEPVPERLIAAARARPAQSSGTVVNLAGARDAPNRRTSTNSGPWLPAAMAASLLVGLAAGYWAWHGPSALIRDNPGGGLVASAALADALTTQLSDDRSTSHAAITGLSFRTKAGDYCRTFSLAGADASSGLACHEDNSWKIKALAPTPAESNAANFRTAGSEIPPPIRAAVEGSIDGEPLDHAAELAARQAGWKPTPPH